MLIGLGGLLAGLISGAVPAQARADQGPAAGNEAVRPQPSVAHGEPQVAILAGGCFWGMQGILRKVPGVVSTEVGFDGGRPPRQGDPFSGRSNYAEAIRVVFDPAVLSYQDLLEKWFFRMHDPTTRDRQGNDVGHAYRSAIFYLDDAQKAAAEAVKARVERSGRWKKPLTTEISRSVRWYKADESDQDYLVKHPNGYTCHYLRPE